MKNLGKIQKLVRVQRNHFENDTELAIIVFRNRMAENCNVEVTSEDTVKGDKP